MKVNYNASAIIANNTLRKNDNRLSDSIARLSAGLKVTHAKDNPSGLAMAKRMNAQLEGMGVATNSAKDGTNIIKTADGVLSEIHDMLQRMNELAVKGATDTLTDTDRDYVQQEIQQLKDEVQRIAASTDFNGQHLFDGTFDLRGYATARSGGAGDYETMADRNIKVISYSDNVPAGDVMIQGFTTRFDPDTNTLATASTTSVTDKEGNTYSVSSICGNVVTFKDDRGLGKEFSLQAPFTETGGLDVRLDMTGKGAMTVQVGANEGQVLDIRIPKITLSALGLDQVSVKKVLDRNNPYDAGTGSFGYLEESDAAKQSIEDIKNALVYVSELRARLGAYQNRLEHTETNLDVTGENLTAAYSQIMDVDMAQEMTTYSTQQVLSQAGVSILAQANERASLALQLLQ